MEKNIDYIIDKGDNMIINTYNDFLNIVSKNKRGIFLICGQEKNLIRKSIKVLYDLITFFPEINLITLSGENINVDSIINSCETMPFFSDRKLVHIKNPDFLKKTKKESSNKNPSLTKEESVENISGNLSSNDIVSFLSKYILELPDNIIFLISYNDDIDLNNKFVTSVKNSGYLVQYNLLKAKDIENIAVEMFKDRGKDIKKAELAYFISDISSIDELEMEIDKICAFAIDEKIITKAHIDAVSYKGIESNIFKLVDAVIKKNADGAISIINNLLFQGENHLIILAMIIRQYRLIYNVKRYLLLKKEQSEIKRILKIKSDIILKNLIVQSNNMNFDELKRAFDLCLEADCNIKRGRISPNLSLEMLIVNLCN
ncbi:DNA polymerase III subunit delta [Caloramator sp. E03]|uniref:DNA polymerase III subunit delta n=1 Tax=Caloramator sp. E03 TaxID=2576307 RepID=UPI00143D433B|nr:DNA polymerase III subunit delta [Caloramator sp. E03]